MFQLQRILVPIDFSDSSITAVGHAGALARLFHAELTLIHVDEFLLIYPHTGPLGFTHFWESIRSEHVAARQKELNEFGAEELSGISVKRIVCSGDPAKLIVERARSDNSDLILMPTHGGGSFRRFLLGSVTAKVLHDADCPVWTGAHLARQPALSSTDVRRVMCAINFGPQSSKAIRWAADFASKVGAKLTAVYAALESPNLLDRSALQGDEQTRHGLDERLHKLLVDSGIEADSLVVKNGDIPRVISAAAKEKKAELLVIGRSCVGEKARLGANAYAIICNASCPVVSV
jgi:nucleotide-binding universal stress UspA family protein